MPRPARSALLLVPAGFLALLVLAALAVDQARILGVRRELLDLSASIAADAVAASLDPDAYHRGGDLVAAEARGRELLDEQLAARGLTGRVSGTITVRDGSGGPSISVALTTSTTSMFARFAPGGWRPHGGQSGLVGDARHVLTRSATAPGGSPTTRPMAAQSEV